MLASVHYKAKLITCLSLYGIVSCGDPSPDDEEFESASATDGATDTGNDSGGEQGADETGPFPAQNECLYDPIDGLYGYRYQCEGSVSINFVVEHAFEGSPEIGLFELEFGPNTPGDDYNNPLVMGCCPFFNTGEPLCTQPHERACWIDVIEQGCRSMIDKIEAYAHDQFPGVLNTAKRNAVLKVAEHITEHQADCIAAFRDNTNIASTLQTCDAEDNSEADFGNMLEAGFWSFDPPGAVQNVELWVDNAEFANLYPLNADQPPPEICWSADENDATRFVEVDPPSDALTLHLGSGSATLFATSTESFIPLDETSLLTVTNTSLENLMLRSEGNLTMSINGMEISLDSLHLNLRRSANATLEGSTLTIAPGTAEFGAGVTALGTSRHRWVTNSTPIILTQTTEGWQTSSFAITEFIDDELWIVTIAPAAWNPEP